MLNLFVFIKIAAMISEFLMLSAYYSAKQQAIQHIIDNLQISALEYRNESDSDVCQYVHDRKIELIEVRTSMGPSNICCLIIVLSNEANIFSEMLIGCIGARCC